MRKTQLSVQRFLRHGRLKAVVVVVAVVVAVVEVAEVVVEAVEVVADGVAQPGVGAWRGHGAAPVGLAGQDSAHALRRGRLGQAAR